MILVNNVVSKILFVNEDSQDLDVFKVCMNFITGTRIFTLSLHQSKDILKNIISRHTQVQRT